MRLEQLLFHIVDTSTVIITNFGDEIARYDGKNHIPSRFNNKLVDNIRVKDNTIIIEIMEG